LEKPEGKRPLERTLRKETNCKNLKERDHLKEPEGKRPIERT
jgi:hypothetical protein